MPAKPRADFPLFPHKGGQWRKDVWQLDPKTGKKRSVPYYFGPWSDDPKGERALRDWLARKDAILAGLDSLRAPSVSAALTVGELMGRFLTAQRTRVQGGQLALPTFKDYLSELEKFADTVGTAAQVEAMRPTHFAAYASHLVGVRKLGPHARKRVIAYVKAMFRWGAENGHAPLPLFGSDFEAPDTSPEAVRKVKLRTGQDDNSQRVVTGAEVTKLLEQCKGKPQFRAIVLLGVNCGLGPADIGRLRWKHIDLANRTLNMPRGKTGVERHGFLWKRTVKALERVKQLKHNRLAIEKEGGKALVFVSRRGQAMYREQEVVEGGKVVGVKIANSISGTFGRMAKAAGLEGVTHYRLRHTHETLGQAAGDQQALDYMMGHKDRGMRRVYNHAQVSLARVRRVAKVIFRELWPKPKERTTEQTTMKIAGGETAGEARAA